MKQKLRLGHSYALTKHNLKYYKIKYMSLLAVLTSMCLYVHAQDSGLSEPAPLGSINDVQGVIIGDSLPQWFWELEINVVNHPEGKTSVRLGNYRDKMLVLDFLNTACSPCIASVDEWNRIQPYFVDEVAVLPVHLYGDNPRLLPFAQKREWHLPVALGNRADTLLNQLFYSQKRFGQIWIMDGRFYATPQHKAVNKLLVEAVFTNEDDVAIPMDLHFSHSANRRGDEQQSN